MKENEETQKVVVGEKKEAKVDDKKDPFFEILDKEKFTGYGNRNEQGLSDAWLESIRDMNGKFIYIREVGNHIEIGPAKVNFVA